MVPVEQIANFLHVTSTAFREISLYYGPHFNIVIWYTISTSILFTLCHHRLSSKEICRVYCLSFIKQSRLTIIEELIDWAISCSSPKRDKNWPLNSNIANSIQTNSKDNNPSVVCYNGHKIQQNIFWMYVFALGFHKCSIHGMIWDLSACIFSCQYIGTQIVLLRFMNRY